MDYTRYSATVHNGVFWMVMLDSQHETDSVIGCSRRSSCILDQPGWRAEFRGGGMRDCEVENGGSGLVGARVCEAYVMRQEGL